MLLKWLFLLILAWYIYRAVGNLINALLGKRKPPQRIRRPESRVPEERAANTSDDHSDRIEQRDVEDARWKDV